MKKAQTIMLVVAVVLLIISFMYLDFYDLRWEVNSGSYIGMISMTCLILSMTFSILQAKYKK